MNEAQSQQKEGNNKDQSGISEIKTKKTIEKISEIKSQFFEKTNKIDKTLAIDSPRKKERGFK